MAPANATYAARAKAHQNPLARQLLELMERKQSNLAVSIDVTKSEELLRIADLAGPYICIVKTHIDIVEDFTKDTVDRLTELSKKHDFLIFEDRKFADIGNTVSLQYSSGVYKIASWAHITNAHAVPGDGVVAGLKKIGQPLGRGLLMLAEMSSAGSLATGSYTAATVKMARRHQDFVMGFIAQRRMSEREDEDFLVLTPGVQMESKGDAMGQQYRTPEQVIHKDGCDVLIVGRGIYGQPDKIAETSQIYKAAGWEAYQRRCSQ